MLGTRSPRTRLIIGVYQHQYMPVILASKQQWTLLSRRVAIPQTPYCSSARVSGSRANAVQAHVAEPLSFCLLPQSPGIAGKRNPYIARHQLDLGIMRIFVTHAKSWGY